MTTPSEESPVEEVVYELEPSRVPKPIPVALEDLCKQTKFSRQEIRIMYRGFKTCLERDVRTIFCSRYKQRKP
ncbi:hypothetical protein ILUMI_09364 [Ignelater luminosus]|uniref:Uncharacterized protein n=1 Tax=Ignelater luminosus TaxID=2038154 RepID=A0A8K0D5X5_IGNLU|nr:hypothetical protein ILUMI_09364 [Ignelater luminosus]